MEFEIVKFNRRLHRKSAGGDNDTSSEDYTSKESKLSVVRVSNRLAQAFLPADFSLGNISGRDLSNKLILTREFGQACRRKDILVIGRAGGQVTRFDSVTWLCDAPRLGNHDAERRATKMPFSFMTDYFGLGVRQLASLLGMLLGLLSPIWPDAGGILF